MEEIDFGKCVDCPHTQHVTRTASRISELAGELCDAALDPSVDHDLAPEIFELLQGVGGLQDPESGDVIDSPEGVANVLRKGVAGLIDQMEYRSNDLQNRVQSITEGCGGPLKMRATKDGRTITVTVCNSLEAPDGVSCEEVHLKREQG